MESGPSLISLAKTSLNHRCDRRVCYCALIFAADIVPSLSTIQWNLKKPACESTEGSARPLKKKISCQTQKRNFWKRPSTDFDKNYIFRIGTSSAIEWYLPFLLSISWPSDEPWYSIRQILFSKLHREIERHVKLCRSVNLRVHCCWWQLRIDWDFVHVVHNIFITFS